MFQIYHKLSRISWLFTQRGQGVELGTNDNKSRYIAVGSEEDLNQGPPDFKSSALIHSATLLNVLLD